MVRIFQLIDKTTVVGKYDRQVKKNELGLECITIVDPMEVSVTQTLSGADIFLVDFVPASSDKEIDIPIKNLLTMPICPNVVMVKYYEFSLMNKDINEMYFASQVLKSMDKMKTLFSENKEISGPDYGKPVPKETKETKELDMKDIVETHLKKKSN